MDVHQHTGVPPIHTNLYSPGAIWRDVLSLKTLFGSDAEILHERDFQLLLLANSMPPLGSGLLAPILDTLIDPFGASAANIGLLISFYTAPAILMIPLAGVLADRYGRKPILLAALVLFGIAGTAIAFTTDFRIALLLRAFQGIAFAGLVPIIITSIGDLFAANREATAQGFRFTGSGIISTIFPLFSSLLVLIAWQFPFLVYAMALPIAMTVYLWFEEPSTVHSRERADDETNRSQIRAIIRLVTQRRVLALVIGRGLPMFAWIGIITYNSIVIVRVLNGTPTQTGIVVAIGSLMYATTASQAGRITAFFDSRFYPLLGANVLLGVGFGLFHLATSVGLAVIGVIGVGAGFGLALSLYRSIITTLAGEELRGSLVSLAESFGRVVATLTPIIMGGIIVVLRPQFGLVAAVRLAGIVIAIICSGGGVICLLAATTASEVQHSR